ncbi:MAG: hypothetical protein L0Y56_03445 [Nitrospira sp.]|nr:hypothetical protein [Nitrospira sp.]
MKRLILFAAIGLLLSLTFTTPVWASDVHVHFGAFWVPGAEGYVDYPPPAYVISPGAVIVLPPVLAIDVLRPHHPIHHDHHWTHKHKYWKHRYHSKPHRQFRDMTIHHRR